jgi:ribonuclease D
MQEWSHPLYIKTTDELLAFIASIGQPECLAVDTEFIREKSYYPQLCLLQLATPSQSAIVDPLGSCDLTALAPLMASDQVVKIFHAGDQDCAIILHELGVTPHPLFDTQRAAQLCGYPNQIGLGALVKQACGVSLDKSDSFSDWERRPLSDRQVEYALNDVRYLPGIYKRMEAKLAANGRLEWLREDFEHMSDPATYAVDPLRRWEKVKHTSSLNTRQLAVVRDLAAWRERRAQLKDWPRKWVLTDELIIEVAKRQPRTEAELYGIRTMREKLGAEQGREVLGVVEQALATPERDLPVRKKVYIRDPEQLPLIDMLAALLHARAHEHQVSSTYVATHDDLALLASGQREGVALLSGWRRELVGAEMLELLDGNLTLGVTRGHLKVTAPPR